MKGLSRIALGVFCLLPFGQEAQASMTDFGAAYAELADEEEAQQQPAPRPAAPSTGTGSAPTGPAPAGTSRVAPTQPAAPAPATRPPSLPAVSPATPMAPASSPPASTTTSPDVAALGRAVPNELASSTFSSLSGDYGGISGISSGGIPVMIGDLGPIPELRAFRQVTGSGGLPSPFPPPTPPTVPRPLSRRTLIAIPSVRGIKICENQSPRPQDRVYFSVNYFQGVNDQVNQKLRAPIGYTQVFRYVGGFEKTFFDGQASIGIQAPLDNITAMSSLPKQYGNYGGSSTAVGDISIYAKYILLEDRETGNLLSGGLAISPPTGPGKFAGLNSLASVVNTTNIQPFVGYIYNINRFYLHGFLEVDVPANSQSATLLYNDFGVGYFVRKPDPDSGYDPLISMIAPTFEVHVTDPLNHRDPLNPRDPAGLYDIVNLTYGLNIGIFSRTILTLGIVTPVTSPKPFDFEALAYINFFYGGSRRSRAQQTPPVIGN